MFLFRKFIRYCLLGWCSVSLVGCQQEDTNPGGYTEVSGYARDMVTQQPVSKAFVELLEAYDGPGNGSISIGASYCALTIDSMTADASGHFQFQFTAKRHYQYFLRATADDYQGLGQVFDVCQPEKTMSRVRAARRTITDAPVAPIGYVRIHTVDDPALTQYKSGSVSEDYVFLGRSDQPLIQNFNFGRDTGRPYSPDTSRVFVYQWYPSWYPIGNTRLFSWYPFDGGNSRLPAVGQQLTLIAHDTIDWEIRY